MMVDVGFNPRFGYHSYGFRRVATVDAVIGLVPAGTPAIPE